MRCPCGWAFRWWCQKGRKKISSNDRGNTIKKHLGFSPFRTGLRSDNRNPTSIGRTRIGDNITGLGHWESGTYQNRDRAPLKIPLTTENRTVLTRHPLPTGELQHRGYKGAGGGRSPRAFPQRKAVELRGTDEMKVQVRFLFKCTLSGLGGEGWDPLV